jgi:hypothetical protein
MSCGMLNAKSTVQPFAISIRQVVYKLPNIPLRMG